MNQPAPILHLTTSTNTGGAEMMLYKVASGLDPARFSCRVVGLMPTGDVGRMIQDAGIPVDSLDLSKTRPNPLALVRLGSIIHEFRPKIIMTWLYHADLLGVLAKRVFPGTALAWNLRCSEMNLKKSTAAFRWLCARLSFLPGAVVANSHTGLEKHRELGYRPRRSLVIPNGFDTERFKPNSESRKAMRQEWNVPDEALLVGLAGRFDVMKGIDVFCRAAGQVLKNFPQARFVLCGEGLDANNGKLMSWLAESRAKEAFTLLGKRSDMDKIYPALDVFCLSSLGEGFPNVVGEAMASGLACVVTDVGDCRRVVGDTGRVVNPGDPEALARALEEVLAITPEERAKTGRAARRRVEETYSIKSIVVQYEKLYTDLLANQPRT